MAAGTAMDGADGTRRRRCATKNIYWETSMGTRYTNCSTRRSTSRRREPARTTLGAAVCIALYGMPQVVHADPQATSSSNELSEITVTATRREEKLEAIPYSISVVSADEIARTGVTDLASLANEVPGLSFYDFGARQTGAEVPIMRGLNASDTSVQGRAFRTFEQSPVGMYIGNSPVDGYFQLDD